METFALSDGEFGVTFCEPLRDSEGWLHSFVVRIEAPGLSVAAQVENSMVIQGPESLFDDMAQSWRGWSGEKTWHALEGELVLCATTDSLGHVSIQVLVQPGTNPEAWSVTALAVVEAGRLDALAAGADRFFGRQK